MAGRKLRGWIAATDNDDRQPVIMQISSGCVGDKHWSTTTWEWQGVPDALVAEWRQSLRIFNLSGWHGACTDRSVPSSYIVCIVAHTSRHRSPIMERFNHGRTTCLPTSFVQGAKKSLFAMVRGDYSKWKYVAIKTLAVNFRHSSRNVSLTLQRRNERLFHYSDRGLL